MKPTIVCLHIYYVLTSPQNRTKQTKLNPYTMKKLTLFEINEALNALHYEWAQKRLSETEYNTQYSVLWKQYGEALKAKKLQNTIK